MSEKRTLGDYDIWYKPCENCGFDTAKVSKENNKCWKCGRQIHRDFSDRALKVKPDAVSYTEAELREFRVLVLKAESLRQMDRIEARFGQKKFTELHGKEKCDAMYEVLKKELKPRR